MSDMFFGRLHPLLLPKAYQSPHWNFDLYLIYEDLPLMKQLNDLIFNGLYQSPIAMSIETQQKQTESFLSSCGISAYVLKKHHATTGIISYSIKNLD